MSATFLTHVLLMIYSLISMRAFAEGGGEAKPETKSEAPKGGEGEHKSEGEAAAPPAPVGPSRKYVPGTVAPFPEFTGTDLKTGEPYNFKPQRGRATLVIFIASWCEPCQELMPKLKSLAIKYDGIYTDVIYVFAHDTKADATGFAKEHKLSGHVLLATNDILKAFKNPELPSVYVSDRYMYLGNRYLKIDSAKIEELDKYMAKLTVL